MQNENALHGENLKKIAKLATGKICFDVLNLQKAVSDVLLGTGRISLMTVGSIVFNLIINTFNPLSHMIA